MFKLLTMNSPTCCYNWQVVKKQIIKHTDFATYTLPVDFVSLISVEWSYNDNWTHKQLSNIQVTNTWITTNETITEWFIFIQYLSNEKETMSKYTSPIVWTLALLVLTFLGYNVEVTQTPNQLADSNTWSVVEEIYHINK